MACRDAGFAVAWLLAVVFAAGCATSGTTPEDVGRDDVGDDDAGDVEPDADTAETVDDAAGDAADEGGGDGAECTIDDDCNDGIACTTDRCDGGRCANVPDDALCDDGNGCTVGERCDAAFGCLAGAPVDCTDGIDCTRDECSPLSGECINTPDHRRCTEPEFCYPDAGGCAAAPPCGTDDDCDDGNACNGIEICNASSACERGAPIDCNDGVDCTRDSCDPATSTCSHAPLDSRCDNGNVCDGVETCDAVYDCERGTPIDCDDGVDCTDDSCNPVTGDCRHDANDARCNDGVFCDGAETCDAAAGCLDGTAPDCDDGVDCTSDGCDATADRCLHEARDEDCDDDAFCNGVETCSAAAGCVPGTPPVCDDGLTCTTDRCDPTAAGGAGACVAEAPDADGDTYADAACGGDDCDDGATPVHPGATETCNARDDDCDAATDETFDCVRGQVRGCTASGGCTGAETCGASCTWGACIVSATEICNGVDDTCNGVADETFPCVLGATRSCAVGACGGIQSCVAGCEWGTCEVSAAEICNGIDDDCDGTTDEGFTCVVGASRSCTVGACTGTQTCSGACAWGGCALPAEACNGSDDDCDGATDEDFACRLGATRACSNACGVSGTETCAAGTCAWGDCCAASETCGNGCDDDCDTTPDDGCCVVGDTCDCPEEVAAGGGRDTGTTVGMTNDFTASCGAGAGSPDVVYRLVLTESRYVYVDTNGSSYDTVLHLRSGPTCPGSSEVECDDDDGEGQRSLIHRTLAAGTYWIIVDGYGTSNSGSYILNVGIGSGDSCTQPREIGGEGTYSGSTCGFNDRFRSTSCGGGAAGADVVYRFDLPTAETVTFDLCGSSASFDTIVHVDSGTCGAGTEVGCNDDSAACADYQSRLTVSLSPGTYHVIVDGYAGYCGVYQMIVSYD